jgi:hypothetical protein
VFDDVPGFGLVLSAGVGGGVFAGGVDLEGEVFAGVKVLDEEGELAAIEEGDVPVKVGAVLGQDLVKGLTGEGAVGDLTADPVGGLIDDSGGEVVDFPAFADVFAGGQGFAQDGLELATAPDFFNQAGLKLEGIQ